MNFNELVKYRQSVRRYSSKAVSDSDLGLILEAARLSPSACNSQPWSIIIVNEKPLVKEVAKATYDGVLRFNRFASQAPVLLVIVMEKPKTITTIGGRIKNKEYPLYDIGILGYSICLQASELKLGTCMLGWFNEAKIKKLLNIPEHKTIGLVITLGHPEEGYKQRLKTRKKLEDIISYNAYKQIDKLKRKL